MQKINAKSQDFFGGTISGPFFFSRERKIAPLLALREHLYEISNYFAFSSRDRESQVVNTKVQLTFCLSLVHLTFLFLFLPSFSFLYRTSSRSNAMAITTIVSIAIRSKSTSATNLHTYFHARSVSILAEPVSRSSFVKYKSTPSEKYTPELEPSSSSSSSSSPPPSSTQWNI